MEIALIVIVSVVIVLAALAAFELRIRRPDALVLFESKGQISFRKGLFYPRHFSLHVKRTTHPIQLSVNVSAAGNLGISVKLAGSVAPTLEHIQALVRVGGWDQDALARAADEAQVLLEGMIKEYTERSEIHALSSTSILTYLYEQASQIEARLGIELVSLAVQSLEPTDPDIAEALRQQEKARLLEQTERLNQQARALEAKARLQTDEEIAILDHNLELKKLELNKTLLEVESAQARQRLEDELERSRMRLAFEKEEVEVLKSSPELLMLTPQAARLAEASQSLKSARTVISFTPQELAQGSALLGLFQRLLQKNLDTPGES